MMELDTVKINKIEPGVPKDTLIDVLSMLKGKLADIHHPGVAIATAGFRLVHRKAKKTWRQVRQWNEEKHLLAKCDLAKALASTDRIERHKPAISCVVLHVHIDSELAGENDGHAISVVPLTHRPLACHHRMI